MNDNNNTINEEVLNSLSEENVEQLSKVIEDNVPENIKMLRKIQEGDVGALDNDEPTTMKASIDPITGDLKTLISENDEEEEDIDAAWEQLVEELKDAEDFKFTKENVSPIVSSLKYSDGKSPLADTEIDKLATMITNFGAGEKPKFDDLPAYFQNQIVHTIMDSSSESGNNYTMNLELKQQMTEAFITNVYQEVLASEYQSVTSDLNTNIKTIMHDELGKAVSDDRGKQHKIMLEQFPIIASRIKNDEPEKAEAMLKISKAYKQAFTLEDMYNSYAKGKPKVKKIDVEKLHRLSNSFNGKYANNKWSIQDVQALVPILDRNLRDDYNINTIKAFVAIFIRYTMNMNPNNLEDHVFMYYVIYNIASLDLYRGGDGLKEEDKKFYEELLEILDKFMVLIEDRFTKKYF